MAKETNELSSNIDFTPSVLGTKSYWDSTYDRELKTYKDIGDVGEIWFGEDRQNRVVDWIEQSSVQMSDPVIDLGCGNGIILTEMRRLGFTDLTGVDYSQGAIDLAVQIANAEGFPDIKYQVVDILSDINTGCPTCLSRQYKVCIDKGTYDAICLMPDGADKGRQFYKRNVKSLLQNDGLLVITSCNWTKDQLVLFFETDFELFDEIKTPSFQFGGKTGNTVTSLIFKRK
ncbi:EEF1A lysine methyltransferase 2-like [Gigantopelta aegis]|uniref:EEF1A lysine methyltransferase 2-like n=1 Tax=Gigantopelta aegis TaxID=1735272 RepID=UPI001B88A0A4|nr:EEF1A lysine methyltransferase 2-like [Gigantopelta aegis]